MTIIKRCDKIIVQINFELIERGELMSFKITLKAARVNAGLTREEAAEKCKISVSTLKNWELGINYPKLPAIDKLCNLYGIKYDNINFDISR